MRVRLMANIAELVFPSALFTNEWSAPIGEAKTRRVMVAPYGDWPNTQGLQRFKKEDADNIVNEFNRPANVLKRTMGLAWYIGHPDHPHFSNRYTDTKAYGRIKDMEVGDDGLYANVRFNTEGEKLIADEMFHGHSVNWFLKEDPKQKGVWRPFRLKSVGFTNEPNIPVPPVTTANEEQLLPRWQLMANLRLFGNTNFHESAAVDATKQAFKASAKAAETGDEVDHHAAVTAHLEAKKANEKSRDAKGGCPVKDAAAEQHGKMAEHHMRQAKASKKAAEGSAEEEAKETPAEEAKEKQAGNEISQEDLRQRLGALIGADARFKKTSSDIKYPSSPWITDVFAPEGAEQWKFIAQLGDGKYYAANFVIASGEPVLSDGDPVEVERKTTFVPAKKQAANEDISECAADAPMKNRWSRMANLRKKVCGKPEAESK